MWCQPSWFPFVYLIYKREGIYNFFTISVNLSKFCSHLWHSWDLASWQFSYNKSTRCTNFSHLFWRETLHVSDSSSVHHQEFFAVHTAMVYVIQVCWQLASRIMMELCCTVQWKTPDDGQRNCLKHVEFPSKINLRN